MTEGQSDLRRLQRMLRVFLALLILALGLTVGEVFSIFMHYLSGQAGWLDLAVATGPAAMLAVGYFDSRRHYEKRKLENALTNRDC
jgi:hypothetical protein